LETLKDLVESKPWIVTTTASDYIAEIGTALSGNVEHNIDGGGWNSLITSPATSATGITYNSGESVVFRHNDNGTANETFFEIRRSVAVAGAYGILLIP
jgi:hypothetical protein